MTTLRTNGSAQNTTGTIFGKVLSTKGDTITVEMAGKELIIQKTDAVAILKTELVTLQNSVDKVKAPSKKSLAYAIFTEMKGAARKEVTDQFQALVGLSKAGSNTYYQNFKTGKGNWS